MLSSISRNWWAFVLRGGLAIAFGVAAIAWPAITLIVLVTLFGAFAIMDGLLAGFAAFGSRDGVRWPMLLWGVLGIGAGVAVIAWPGITALVLVYLIAAWAIITGALQVAAAAALRRELEGEWVLAVGGVLSVVIGIGLAVFPGTGALSLAWLIGAYAILAGLTLIVFGFRVRSLPDRVAAIQASSL